MFSTVKTGNPVQGNILGLNGGRMCMRVVRWLQIKVMLEKCTLRFPFVDCKREGSYEEESQDQKYPFHAQDIVATATFFKVGACPC